jgi:hypothetical protein
MATRSREEAQQNPYRGHGWMPRVSKRRIVRGVAVHMLGGGAEPRAAMPGAPYLCRATSWALRRPASNLGEHTEEVRAERANSTWVGKSAIPQIQGASGRVANPCSGMEGLCACGF